MDAAATCRCHTREYLNLTVERPRIKLLDRPTGHISAMAKDNVAHQMRYAVEVLERELIAAGDPHVLQLVLKGDDANGGTREPSGWEFYADGILVASGTGEYARALLCEDAAAFKNLCGEALRVCGLRTWTEDEYCLLSVARRVAAVGECRE